MQARSRRIFERCAASSEASCDAAAIWTRSRHDRRAHYLTTKPCANGSRSSMKIVLKPVMPRPAADRGDDGRLVGDRRPRLDAALEQRADDRFVDEVVADLRACPWRQAAPCAPRCRCRRASGRSPCRHRRRRCGHRASGCVGAPVHRMWESPLMSGFSGWTKLYFSFSAAAASGSRRSGRRPSSRPCRGSSPAARRWRRNCRHRRRRR